MVEDIKQKAYKQYNIIPKHNGFGQPTNDYKIGESVRVGNLKNCVVDEIREINGVKCYGIIHDRNINSSSENEKEYDYFTWYEVMPYDIGKSNSHFTKENNVDIHFNNTSLESLLKKFYLSGIDMNPEYQRGYVWDDKDKEFLLDSIFAHIEIGKFAFIRRDYSQDCLYEILDGKQRLSTLLEYYENQFPYKGVYYKDLSPEDRYTFLTTNVSIGETSEMSKEQIYEYFIRLNTTGKVMDTSHLEKVKGIIDLEADEDIER